MEILLVQNIPKKEISIKRKKKETNCIILRNSIRSMLENIAGRISKHPRSTSAQHRTKNTTLCYYTKSNPSLEPTQVVAWTLSPNHPRSRPTANSPRFSPPHSSGIEWNMIRWIGSIHGIHTGWLITCWPDVASREPDRRLDLSTSSWRRGGSSCGEELDRLAGAKAVARLKPFHRHHPSTPSPALPLFHPLPRAIPSYFHPLLPRMHSTLRGIRRRRGVPRNTRGREGWRGEIIKEFGLRIFWWNR